MAGLTKLDHERYRRHRGCIEPQRDAGRNKDYDDFVEWLLSTHEGDEALQLINNTKRQRFLPFDSQKEE